MIHKRSPVGFPFWVSCSGFGFPVARVSSGPVGSTCAPCPPMWFVGLCENKQPSQVGQLQGNIVSSYYNLQSALVCEEVLFVWIHVVRDRTSSVYFQGCKKENYSRKRLNCVTYFCFGKMVTGYCMQR